MGLEQLKVRIQKNSYCGTLLSLTDQSTGELKVVRKSVVPMTIVLIKMLLKNILIQNRHKHKTGEAIRDTDPSHQLGDKEKAND